MFSRLLVVACVLAAVWATTAQAQTVPNHYIVVLKDGADRGAAVRQARALGGSVSHEYAHALNGYAARLPVAAVDAIGRNKQVLFVSPDREMKLDLSSGSPVATGGVFAAKGGAAATCPLNTQSGFPTQCVPPGIDRIDADRSSARSGDGRGSVDLNVAVLDTGIDGSHPDLNVVGGTNCTNDQVEPTADAETHGTFVAGTIAAKDNGSGVVGIVPGARLWSVHIFRKNGSATTAMMICGVDWTTATRTDLDPTNDIAVANLSGSGEVRDGDDGNCGRTNRDALHLAFCRSVAAGVTWAVAAGNAASDIKDTVPAAYNEVLTATGMADFDGKPGGAHGPCQSNEDDTFAFFSNFWTLADDAGHTVAAPGVCVVSTVVTGWFLPAFDTSYGINSGTSFSSPHVAGTAALCIASGGCAGLSPTEITAKVVADAAAFSGQNFSYGFIGDPLRPAGSVNYGYLLRAGGY